MLSGPSGVGKTTLGMHIINSAAAAGHKAVVFSFEEEPQMILARCKAIGIDTQKQIEKGLLSVVKIEPLFYFADQFALIVRDMVEEQHVKMVMIDSTSGYDLAIKREKLVDHLHVLCKYLQNVGVTVLLVTELTNITGDFKVSYFRHYAELLIELAR
jgi:circadian clock protein KaiC